MGKTVLGIYASPRKGGNTDKLLDEVLEGARQGGARILRLYARELNAGGCLECGGCDKTGSCVVHDDMDRVYPLLEEADVIVLASPIFFYGLTAQVKPLVDRAQALWSKRMLTKSPGQRKRHDGGRGYLVAVGATRGKNLFEGVRLEAKYFFDALDMSFQGGLFYRGIENRRDVAQRSELLEEARAFGGRIASDQQETLSITGSVHRRGR